MSTTTNVTTLSIRAQNTPWPGLTQEEAEAAFARAFLTNGLTIRYRGWKLMVTDSGAKGTNADEEHFEIAHAADFETALRLAKNKVDRLLATE